MSTEFKLLKDYDLEYIQQQYDEKNESLEEHGREVSAWAFYEDIFGTLDIISPAIDKSSRKMLRMPLEDLIDHAIGQEGVFLSACTYFKDYYNSKGLMDVYAFVVDLDSCWSGGLDAVLKNGWQNTSRGNYYLPPTYIVNSGTGLHLYFVLQKPVPAFSKQMLELKNLYRKMALHQSMRPFVGAKPEVHWVGQTFRMPGSNSKQGFRVRAYKMDFGRKYDIQELADQYGIEYQFRYRGEHEDYPEHEKRSYSGTKTKGWYTKRAFYDYCVRNIPEKTQQGHRYMTMCALSAIAFKCNIPKWELKEDLSSFLVDWNKGKVGQDRVERWEVTAAMKMYNDRAYEMRRAVIEEYFGWDFKPIKRNGRKRSEHLKRARLVQTLDYPDGEWRYKQPSAEQIVREWQQSHPDGRKADCIRDTGLSKPTVYKWWNTAAVIEIEPEYHVLPDGQEVLQGQGKFK